MSDSPDEGGEETMHYARDHRAEPRRAVRLNASAEYVPRLSSGRWWETFEVRAVDVSAGGFQVATTVPMQVGAKLRLIVEATKAIPENLSVGGEIVWVKTPAIPWLGIYRAGVATPPAAREAIARLKEMSGAVMTPLAAV
jgi:hypothetical protein